MSLASAAACNQALDGIEGIDPPLGLLDFLLLHTASPSTTGANENANSGGYARQGITWNAAASSSKTNSSAETFSTGGTVAVTHFGTASSGTYGAATWGMGGALAASVTATTITVAAGALTLSAS